MVGVTPTTLRRMHLCSDFILYHITKSGTRYYSSVTSYMYSLGYKFEIIADIGSGINYKKKGLLELINKINNHKVSTVVVLYKDRLMRIGFDLLNYLCKINGVKIEIIDNTEYSKEQELTDDLILIITVFANCIYGQRSKKTKRLIDEMKQNAKGNQD